MGFIRAAAGHRGVLSARYVGRVALALALVSAPLWGPALALSAPTYEYRASLLATGDGTLGFANDSRPPDGGVDGIDCFATGRPERACVHETGLLNDSRTINYPPLLAGNGNPQLGAERYVAFGAESPVYERTAAYAGERGGRYALALKRVTPREALRDVAVGLSAARKPVRAAVETGRGTAATSLPAGRVVAVPTDGGADRYFLVYEERRRSGAAVDDGDAAVLELLAVAGGALLLLDARGVGRRDP
jgi:hypothetical protein